MRGRRGQLRGHIVQDPPGRSPVSSLDRGGGGEGGLGKHFSPVSCLARVTSLRDNNRKRSRIDCCYGTPDTGQHGQTFNFYLFPDPKSQ